VLLWLGEAADEAVPDQIEAGSRTTNDERTATPTAKARILLKRYGLTADVVPSSGARLSVDDIERYVAQRSNPASARGEVRPTDPSPTEAGKLRPLRSDERAMIRTVSWSREFAVPGYIELEYDPEAWDVYARQYSEQRRLMLSPLLSLMAWRMVKL